MGSKHVFGKPGRGVEFSRWHLQIIPSVCAPLFRLFKDSIRGAALLISWQEPKNLGSVATFTICCCPFAQEQLPASIDPTHPCSLVTVLFTSSKKHQGMLTFRTAAPGSQLAFKYLKLRGFALCKVAPAILPSPWAPPLEWWVCGAGTVPHTPRAEHWSPGAAAIFKCCCNNDHPNILSCQGSACSDFCAIKPVQNPRNFAGFRQITHSFFTGNSIPAHPQLWDDESACAEPRRAASAVLIRAAPVCWSRAEPSSFPAAAPSPRTGCSRECWVSPSWSDAFQRS